MSLQSALVSLTATYTDSEGEDGVDEDYEENSNTPRPQTNSQLARSQGNSPRSDEHTASNSPASKSPGDSYNYNSNSSAIVTENVANVRMQRLVSYFDDTVLSDDEGSGAITGAFIFNGKVPPKPNEPQIPSHQDSLSDDDDENSVKLPPKPSENCPVDLQEKFANYYRKMESGRLDMNKIIQQKKNFRNPSIYEKLIQYCNINELGTNYPPERFDPFKWSNESYYEELAKSQKIEMEKLEKARKDKKVEIVSGTAKRPSSTAPTVEDDAKKRKSKWDQIPQNPTAIKQSVTLVQQSLNLTTTITGTKATVISAFGSLPKKRL